MLNIIYSFFVEAYVHCSVFLTFKPSVNNIIMSVFKSICNAVTAIANAIAKLFNYMTAVHHDNVEKQKEKDKQKEEASNALQDACDNGTLDDLIDATQQIGDAIR